MTDDTDVLAKMSIPAMAAAFGWEWATVIVGVSFVAVALFVRMFGRAYAN
jgi:hypothetical protein